METMHVERNERPIVRPNQWGSVKFEMETAAREYHLVSQMYNLALEYSTPIVGLNTILYYYQYRAKNLDIA